jgi:hypothetical protein
MADKVLFRCRKCRRYYLNNDPVVKSLGIADTKVSEEVVTARVLRGDHIGEFTCIECLSDFSRNVLEDLARTMRASAVLSKEVQDG